MCGIVGVYAYRDGVPVDEPALRRMAGVIAHRGPDDDGFFVDGGVGLGMRRLSIIDVTGGHQPIANEDGSIQIVFNGEIYNYRALRADLESRGHLFRTAGDTESIVHAYEEYGDGCVDRLRGMFAFALWDRRRRRLLLARDRAGIKPLYYWQSPQALIFGSELKSILCHPGVTARVNPGAVIQHFAYRYALAPQTVFEGILKLPPGHLLTCADGEITIRRYWRPPEPGETAETEESLAARLRETLGEAVRAHLVSEVPLGAFLSGGVDSSIVVGLMATMLERPVKTFSVGFASSDHDELAHARRVAEHFHTDHHELECRSGSVELLRDLVWHLEEPILDPACIPTYLVSQLARQSVTVVLTGEGSDEVNGGYRKYQLLVRRSALAAAYGALPWAVRRAADRALSGARTGALERFRRCNARTLDWPSRLAEAGYRPFLGVAPEPLFSAELLAAVPDLPPDLTAVFAAELAALPSDVDRLTRLDWHSWLPDDLLLKVDKMSMAHSLEARVPYLDHVFVEFAAPLPLRLKVDRYQTKRLLRRAFVDLVPPGIAGRAQHGFDVPIERWFRHELRDYVRDLLLGPDRTGFFDRRRVAALLRSFFAGDSSLSLLVYGLVIFHVWHERFIAPSPPS